MTSATPLEFSPSSTDAPDPGFAHAMERIYPTDPALEAVLARKLARRADGPFRPSSLPELTKCLEAMLETSVDGDFEVRDPRWMTGGASKIQMAFSLRWRRDGSDREDRMILRMDPSEAINSTSKLREFDIVRAMTGVVPAPTPYWVDALGTWFPEPALVYGIVDGVAKPSGTTSGRVVGLGTNFGPVLRRRLASQFVEHMAAVHTYDTSSASFRDSPSPEVGTTQNALWRLNFQRRVWEEDRGEDNALMELAASWLAQHVPVLDRLSVVHGDYRSGNFLFEEVTGAITGWLDWELAHLGDRHWDLAWCIQPLFGHLAEDDRTFLASGLLPQDELLARYEAASGLTVDAERLDWFRVLVCYSMMVMTIASTYRIARLGRSHQDILLARLEGSRSVIELELLSLLERLV